MLTTTNKKNNMAVRRAIAGLAIIGAIALTALAQGGEIVTDKTAPTGVPDESILSSKKLVRPPRLQSLREFVLAKFNGKVDIETILETQAAGKPAVTFSYSDGLRTTGSILIDNGDSLELHSDNYPTWWKFDPNIRSTEPVEIEWPTGESDEKDEPETMSLAAAAVPTCAGVASPGNPYPCCTASNGTLNMGNCTFMAWESARKYWGYNLPAWGTGGASDARWWAQKLRSSGYPLAQAPGLFGIAVSSSISSRGHVAFTTEVSNDMIYVEEQGCTLNNWGVIGRWRTIVTFNEGFVFSRKGPYPTIVRDTTGTIRKSSSPQAIVFRVTNVFTGKRAVLYSPTGAKSTLMDGQLSNVSNGKITASMTLAYAGTWKIQLFNRNGTYSQALFFTVQ
jgi:surface antigen